MDWKRDQDGDKSIWTIFNGVPLVLGDPHDLGAIIQSSVHHLITRDYFSYCNQHQSLNGFLPAMSVPSQLAIYCFEKGKKRMQGENRLETSWRRSHLKARWRLVPLQGTEEEEMARDTKQREVEIGAEKKF